MLNLDFDEKILSYRMEGKAFEDGFDLNDTLVSLKYFQNILDKAYLAIENKERMSKSDREVFKVKATNIREGSFITDLILYTGAAIQIGYPIINTYHPSLLLDITKEGFLYLKTVLTANKEGKEISVSGTDGGDAVILNIQGDNNAPIHIGTKVYTFAGSAYEDIKNLSSIIDDENIKKIDAFDVSGERRIIELGPKEKELFKAESRLEEEPINIIGKIFRIDIRAKSGKMIVIDSSDSNVPQGEFSFEILLDEDIARCCSAINNETKFSVLKRIQYDPIKLREQVKSLRIVRVG